MTTTTERGTDAAAGASTPAGRPLRADAQRNRDKLVDTAAEVFAGDCVEAPLERIAERAGVGIGTLYRHFPAREDLVLAVYYREVDTLCASAGDRLAEHEPVDALAAWMHDFVAYVAAKRGLAGCMRQMAEKNTALFDRTRAALRGAADRLVTAAQQAGQIRSDVTGEQLLRAMGGICMANDAEGWQEHATQMLGLLLDGLRYGATAPTA